MGIKIPVPFLLIAGAALAVGFVGIRLVRAGSMAPAPKVPDRGFSARQASHGRGSSARADASRVEDGL